MISMADLISESPDNFVIRDALLRCVEVIDLHNKIMCGISGGADSDVMLDMIIRCGGRDKTTFVFFDTGFEYTATKKHLDYLEDKYDIKIERVKAAKPIPTSCKDYGVPFLNKYVSEMMYRLQLHSFRWEDRSFDELIKEYPNCKTALSWWCNTQTGNTTQFYIKRHPYLKEYIVNNPPDFRISGKCCHYAKKVPSHTFEKKGRFDLVCLGIRQLEGGARAGSIKNCFTQGKNRADDFRPVFYFRDKDKDEYCSHYNILHSECYTKYGLVRTGCVGCPFAKRFEEELEIISNYEPNLYKAVNNVFGKSYEYMRGYLRFRKEQSNNES